MTAPIKPVKPDKAPEAQKLRQSLRYISDLRDQLYLSGEVGTNDNDRVAKLKDDLVRGQQAANEDADAYRASRSKKK